jgi:hypothetical protein
MCVCFQNVKLGLHPHLRITLLATNNMNRAEVLYSRCSERRISPQFVIARSGKTTLDEVDVSFEVDNRVRSQTQLRSAAKQRRVV